MPLTLAERSTNDCEDKMMGASGNEISGDRHRGEVRIVMEADGTFVRLQGQHDLSTVGRLGTALVEAATTSTRDVVVDLEGVTFMDAPTVGCLIGGRNLLAMSETRELYVRHPSAASRRLLELVGLGDLVRPDAAGPRQRASALESWVEVPGAAPASAGRPLVPVVPTPAEVEGSVR
ncbi:MAG: STAS domain-containing protein [Acidimicrobiales bacterium]